MIVLISCLVWKLLFVKGLITIYLNHKINNPTIPYLEGLEDAESAKGHGEVVDDILDDSEENREAQAAVGKGAKLCPAVDVAGTHYRQDEP